MNSHRSQLLRFAVLATLPVGWFAASQSSREELIDDFQFVVYPPEAARPTTAQHEAAKAKVRARKAKEAKPLVVNASPTGDGASL